MSFYVVIGKEKMTENIPAQDYVDSTFGSRRFELYETSAESKNTLFINGVGVADNSTVKTSVLEGRGYRGFRINATEAMGTMYDGPAADFCGRAIVLLKDKAVLVIDRVEVPHVALVESRLHTFHSVRFGKDDAAVKGKHERMHISYGATDATLLKEGKGNQTDPSTEGDTILRRVSLCKVPEITIVTFMTPNGKGSVSVRQRGNRTTVKTDGVVKASLAFTTTGLRF